MFVFITSAEPAMYRRSEIQEAWDRGETFRIVEPQPIMHAKVWPGKIAGPISNKSKDLPSTLVFMGLVKQAKYQPRFEIKYVKTRS